MKSSHPSAVTTLWSVASLLCLAVCSPAPVFAQANAPAGKAQLNNRPQSALQQVKLDPELEQILTNWERAGDVTDRLEGKHYRYIYDFVFNVQKVSQGEFYYESPDKGRIDLDEPETLPDGPIMVRGKKFDIRSDKAERWICDGTQVVAIDEERKEFQRIPIPVESRGQNIADGPLPFLFGISKEKIKVRYNITLHDDAAEGGQHNQQAGKIHLKVKPNYQADAANWQSAEIMLDARTYLPHAIRLIHPGGNAETVYVFHDVKRNARRGVFALWQGSPFEPKLSGYKELTSMAEGQAVPKPAIK